LFVAVIAPVLFVDFRELEIGLTFLGVAMAVLCYRHRSRELVNAVAGGLLGTIFVVPWLRSGFDGGEGVVAEWITFTNRFGWHIAGAFIAFIAAAADLRKRTWLGEWRPRTGLFVVALAASLALIFIDQARHTDGNPAIRASRNFYGTLKVFDYTSPEEGGKYYLLMHGGTTHGLQFASAEKQDMITSYYGPASGAGLAVKHLLPDGPRHIGVVGLGTGTLAAFARSGDRVRYYEINPAVEKLARDPFTYLARCKGQVDVVYGDARLTMERELAEGQPQQFNLLALDAFSSDAVPAHLLTHEAFEIYLRHLAPDGVIALHISNRYLDLQPVVDATAAHFNLGLATISDDLEEHWHSYSSTWVLLSRNRELLKTPAIVAAKEEPAATARPPLSWTDDHVSLFEVLK
jgi:spermidine synthase